MIRRRAPSGEIHRDTKPHTRLVDHKAGADIPFLRACDRGVLVQAEDHELKDERYPTDGLEVMRPVPFPTEKLYKLGA